VVVRTPLRFLEPCLTSDGDPINECLKEQVVGCTLREGGDVVEMLSKIISLRLGTILYFLTALVIILM
jgi:hypothetical protein